MLGKQSASNSSFIVNCPKHPSHASNPATHSFLPISSTIPSILPLHTEIDAVGTSVMAVKLLRSIFAYDDSQNGESLSKSDK